MGKNLRGNIVRCSDSFSEFLTGFVGLSGTKIDDLNLVVLHTGFKKNVFGLQIAMDNLMGVAIGHAGKKLLQKNGCVSLIEFTFVNDFVEEFTTLNVIGDDVEALVVLEVFVNLDDVGVIEGSERVNLIKHGHLLLFVHVFFLEDFDGALLFGLAMGAQTNLSKGSLAEQVTDLVDIAQSSLRLLNEHLSANFDTVDHI